MGTANSQASTADSHASAEHEGAKGLVGSGSVSSAASPVHGLWVWGCVVLVGLSLCAVLPFSVAFWSWVCGAVLFGVPLVSLGGMGVVQLVGIIGQATRELGGGASGCAVAGSSASAGCGSSSAGGQHGHHGQSGHAGAARLDHEAEAGPSCGAAHSCGTVGAASVGGQLSGVSACAATGGRAAMSDIAGAVGMLRGLWSLGNWV